LALGLGFSAVVGFVGFLFFFFCLLVFSFLCILLVCLEAPYAFLIYLFAYLSKKSFLSYGQEVEQKVDNHVFNIYI
jgi:hypothetical protein